MTRSSAAQRRAVRIKKPGRCTDHIVLRWDVQPARLECERCGETYTPKLPSAMPLYLKRCKAFIRMHEDCVSESTK